MSTGLFNRGTATKKISRWGNFSFQRERSSPGRVTWKPQSVREKRRSSEMDKYAVPARSDTAPNMSTISPLPLPLSRGGFATPGTESELVFTPDPHGPGMSPASDTNQIDNIYPVMSDYEDEVCTQKSPLVRQLSSVYDESEICKMTVSPAKLIYRRTSASSVELKWKHIFPCYKGRYTLQEQCDGAWSDIYKGNLCRWEIVGMEEERKHCFRVVNDLEKVVTPVSEVILHKQSSIAEVLGRAIAVNDYEKIALICHSRPQPNINVPDACGMSPLMRACAMGRCDIVQTLLECGADVNFRNSANRTCAMLASLVGNLSIIKTLVEHKANLKLRDRSGATCLHYAIDSGVGDIVRYLLTQNIEVDAQDNQGWTPLMCLAANKGTLDIAKTLIKAGSDVNYSDNIGKTVLMSASLAGNREMCELLVQSGATHSAYTRFGKSAYEMAVAFDRKEVIEFFQHLKKKRNSVSLGVSAITF